MLPFKSVIGFAVCAAGAVVIGVQAYYARKRENKERIEEDFKDTHVVKCRFISLSASWSLCPHALLNVIKTNILSVRNVSHIENYKMMFFSPSD